MTIASVATKEGQRKDTLLKGRAPPEAAVEERDSLAKSLKRSAVREDIRRKRSRAI